MNKVSALEALERKDARADLSAIDVDGTFSGYATLFGRRDLSGDVVMPGAFRAALAAKGAAGIRMLFQHDPAMPIGAWLDIHEDARGLYVKGRLAAEVAKAREVRALMRAGALDGLSIGFRTVKAQRDRAGGTRRLIEIDLWEISVVTFPMLPEARVSAVKGEAGLLAGLRRAARLFAPVPST